MFVRWLMLRILMISEIPKAPWEEAFAGKVT